MADSWAWWGAKLVAKIGIKVAVNAAAPWLGPAVDFSEAVYDFSHGDIGGGVINALFGISAISTFGITRCAKEAMKEGAKNAVVQTAKETAKTVEKEATKKVGQELGKTLATGAVTGGKDAAVRVARAAAKSAGKAATKKVGEQFAKDIARGVITETVEDVWFQGTKLTFKGMVDIYARAVISNPGNIFSGFPLVFVREVLPQSAERFLKESIATGLVSGLTQEAAKTAAEKESKKYLYKLAAKNWGFASVIGGIRSVLSWRNFE